MARRIFAIGALVLLLAVGAGWLFLPAIVEIFALKKLADLGYEDSALEVVHVGFRELRLKDVRIERMLTIDEASIGIEVWPPRARDVRLAGARWFVSNTVTSTAAKSAEWKIPIEKIALARSEVVVNDDLRFPFDAELEASP